MIYTIDENYHVPIPDGAGLGVEYDCDYIEDNTMGRLTCTRCEQTHSYRDDANRYASIDSSLRV